MEIEKLLRQPESKTLEFKRDLSSMTPILKTIVAFANTAGGVLIIGRSPEGSVLGLEDVFKEEERLANAIADNIHPPILPELEIATVQGNDVLVVKVAHWKGPFYLKKQGVPDGVYVRLGSTSRPAGPVLLEELQRSTRFLSFDQQPMHDLSQESLDLERARGFFKGVAKEATKEKLRSLGVLVPLGKRLVPSIGGLILFGHSAGRQEWVPDVRVSCARFTGIEKVHFLDRFEVEGTILDAVEAVPKFIARNTRLAAQITGMRRRDIPEYPPGAIREVLINALVHSDYSIQGSHTQIAIFDDRLEVQNPGMLPFGFTLDDFKTGVSRIRNRVIARVFHELQLMEEWGSGYKRIMDECRSEGYPEPEWQELGTAVRVVFRSHPLTQYPESRVHHASSEELPKRQEQILAILRAGESLSFGNIYKRLGSSASERTLHYDLSLLRDRGLIVPVGKGRATVWRRHI